MMVKSFQIRWHGMTYQLTFRPGFLVLCLFFVILFCLLGMWQLSRYHYKQTLLATYQQRLTAEPVEFAALQEITEFQPVKVKGSYVNDLVMLVQNRFYQDRLGFEVLTPLRIAGDDRLLLVDRGWVARPDDEPMPMIKPVNELQQIKGHIKLINEYQFILGENILDLKARPIVMQKIDIHQLSEVTHQKFYPFVLRLDATEQNGFVRDWTITAVTPERHLGYAIQWFVMALVLFIAYFCFCCERVKK